ncbi:H-NS family nucleoid-associated regulatory protein [Aliidiomarina quisquiliarum]|uniref:H-NS family histone-like protein n=1 Tax=Aliidiomarina quisquiliarum TaxID=2938947 RepID=UPI00208F6460|nr:H-NS family nucleoid-associated regulatory protein [Aliidiomarina quisquiliarum]MCO4321740.1 H-NS histone family protein [Aliidiomarina quisquiliarum]
MSTFIDILTHARRLNAATKDLSVAELKEVADKLDGVIAKRTEDEAELMRIEQEKQIHIDRIRREMEAAGLDASDILGDAAVAASAKPVRRRAPKPPKYEYTDEDGMYRTWTGQGRSPRPIQQAIDAGGSKEDFLIKK